MDVFFSHGFNNKFLHGFREFVREKCSDDYKFLEINQVVPLGREIAFMGVRRVKQCLPGVLVGCEILRETLETWNKFGKFVNSEPLSFGHPFSAFLWHLEARLGSTSTDHEETDLHGGDDVVEFENFDAHQEREDELILFK